MLDPRVLEGLDPSVGPRCLVTGAEGYLGRHLVEGLVALGCQVRTLDVTASTCRSGVEARVGDVRERACVEDACRGIDTVFHAAAVISLLGLARPSIRDRVFSINVTGTDVVLDAARAAGVGRLVHASTVNVVVDRELHEADESTPYARDLVDLYGRSKTLAERAVLAADAPGGLRTAAIRPGGIWGPPDGCLMIEAILDQLAAGRFVARIGARSYADNTHVLNVVRGMLLAADRLARDPERVGGRAFFVTDDERLDAFEWFRPVVEGLGHAFPSRRLPPRAAYAAALGAEVACLLGARETTFTRAGVLKVTRSSSFCIDRARRDLGYAPILNRDEGVAAHLDEYRAALARRTGALPPASGPGKRVLIAWDPSRRPRTARRALLLDEVVPALRAAGAPASSVLVADEDADVRPPSPFPQAGPDPIALVNVPAGDDDASDRAVEALRAAGLEVAGYLVDESVYTDYGGNRHAGPRDWPDGERSPGVVAVTFLLRPRRLSRDEWIRRWHGRMSPISERLQPRTRYVRNVVVGPVTPGAPPYEGIVEEAWPSARHVTDPRLFYGASGPVELARHMAQIGAAVTSFLDVWRVRTVMMSEYFVGTACRAPACAAR